jgi:hypothetical protein
MAGLNLPAQAGLAPIPASGSSKTVGFLSQAGGLTEDSAVGHPSLGAAQYASRREMFHTIYACIPRGASPRFKENKAGSVLTHATFVRPPPFRYA